MKSKTTLLFPACASSSKWREIYRHKEECKMKTRTKSKIQKLGEIKNLVNKKLTMRQNNKILRKNINKVRKSSPNPHTKECANLQEKKMIYGYVTYVKQHMEILKTKR